MSLRVDIFTDVSCPWCMIALHRFDRVLDQHYPDVEAEITHHPVLLNPELPPEGLVMADLLRDRFGLTDPASAWVKSEAAARDEGIPFDHRTQPMAYPTGRAHILIRLAKPTGHQHALARTLGRAYLIEGRNIAHPKILSEIGGQFGLDPDDTWWRVQGQGELQRTLDEARASKESGVSTVPHFAFQNGVALTGAFTDNALRDALESAMR